MRAVSRFTRVLETLFLGAIFIWSFTTILALVHPASAVATPAGVVEIYSLTAEPSTPMS
jgi:hypothetical protein